MNKTIIAGGLAALLAAGAAIAAPGDRAARMDLDGDGVSIAEMQQHMAERFKRVDANGDGSVTKAEFDAQHARRAEKRAERRAREGHGGPGGHGRMFDRLDADNNGAVTLAEFTRHAGGRVAKFDTDKDGKISRAEFAAGHGGRRGHRQSD